MEEAQRPRTKLKAWPYLTVEFLCNDGEKGRIYRHGCTWEGTDSSVASWSSLNIVSVFLEKETRSQEKSGDEEGNAEGLRERE